MLWTENNYNHEPGGNPMIYYRARLIDATVKPRAGILPQNGQDAMIGQGGIVVLGVGFDRAVRG